MTFGDKLKNYRLNADLKQSELAQKMGVTQNSISSWETGRTEPNLGQLSKLCKILDCTMADLTNTREPKAGEISIDDVLIKISTMTADEITIIERALEVRRREAYEIAMRKEEANAMRMQMSEMQKRLEELENTIEAYENKKRA